MNGGCGHKFLFRVGSWYTTEMSEAWRIFCRPGTNF